MTERKCFIFRFADIEVREREYLLIKEGERVPVEPKAFRVLLFLVRNPGRLLTKDEIVASVWSDSAVSDNSLTRSIAQLRRALGDDSREPLYILTVPTIGYRFLSEVRCEEDGFGGNSPAVPSHIANGNSTEPGLELAAVVGIRTHHPVTPATAAASDMPITERAASNGKTTGSRLRWAALAACLVVSALPVVWFAHSRVHTEVPIRSLAVLPLNDLSAGRREDYFADGMTDELITEIARIPNLRVVSRTSVMQEKGSNKTLRQIAHELNVDAIVEGSVVRSGDRVRITAQLIDTRTDKHLWAESYEGKLSDVLSIQDEVALEISSQARIVLTQDIKMRLSNRKPINPQAYDAYLRGIYFVDKRQGKLATEYLRQAITIDPQYGSAYAGLAEALLTQSETFQVKPVDAMPSAIEAAKRAIELDANSGEAYTALGAIDSDYLWDWPAAEQNLKRGIVVNPNSSLSELRYAIFLANVNRTEEAVTHMRRAAELDPLSFWANRHLGTALYFARHYDESLSCLKRAAELAPDQPALVAGWRSAIYEVQGKYDEAVDSELQGITTYVAADVATSLRTAYKRSGWRGYQQAYLDFLLSHSSQPCVSDDIAMGYLRLDDLDRAFRWLNRGADEHCLLVLTLQADPRFDRIRNDSRYHALLHRMNL